MKDYRNWARIYDVLQDGLISECSRTGCSSSCCSQKMARPASNPDRVVNYRTTLMGPDECHFQNEFFGPLENKGVTLIKIEPEDKQKYNSAYIIDDCSEDESRCKLEGRKPFICRVFPFGLGLINPLDISCPNVVKIFENKDVLKRVLEVRRLLGFYDEQEWLESANKLINDIRGMISLAV